MKIRICLFLLWAVLCGCAHANDTPKSTTTAASNLEVNASNLDTVARAMYDVLSEKEVDMDWEKPMKDEHSEERRKSINKYFECLCSKTDSDLPESRTNDQIQQKIENFWKKEYRKINYITLIKKNNNPISEENQTWAKHTQEYLNKLIKIFDVSKEKIDSYKQKNWLNSVFNWKDFLAYLYDEAPNYPEKELKRVEDVIKDEELCRKEYCKLTGRYFGEKSSEPEKWKEYLSDFQTTRKTETETAKVLLRCLEQWQVTDLDDVDCRIRPWYVVGCFFEFVSVERFNCEGLDEFFPKTPSELFGKTDFFDRSWLESNDYPEKVEAGIRKWLISKFGCPERDFEKTDINGLIHSLQENLQDVRPYHRFLIDGKDPQTEQFLKKFL